MSKSNAFPTLRSIAQLIVRYVSAPPGTGKTNASLEFMRRHILAGLDGKPVGYVFYVAATVELLQQTISNLERLVPATTHFMFRSIYATEQDKFSGYTVTSKILAVLDDKAVGTKKAIPFTHGSILFMTHAAFIELRRHPKFADTIVIFDEARKWADVSEKISFDDPSVEELFHTLFRTEFLKDPVTGKKVENLCSITPKYIPQNQMAQLVSNKPTAKAFNQLHHLHASLTPEGDEPIRMRVFGAVQGKGRSRELIKLVLPSQPFVGFKRVFILSADFETSQMYHLLKLDGTDTRDVTEEFMERYTNDGYVKALRTIQARYKKLTIVPLLDIDDMPSKYAFNGGIIMPDDLMLRFKDRMEALKLNTRHLRDIVAHIRTPHLNRGELQPEQLKMLRFIQENNCQLDITGWMVDRCHRLAKSWTKKHTPVEPGVIIVNKDFQKYELDEKYFRYMDIGKVEGNNAHQHANVVAFLGAINPTPLLAQLMRILMPHYDADEDYVVDKAIQSIGRGNIRNHHSSEEMLAVVSTTGLAKRISKRMRSHPRVATDVTKKLGNFVPWNRNAADAKYAEAVSGEPDRRKRFADKFGDQIKEYRRVSRQISRLQAKLKANPTDVTLSREMAGLTERREALIRRSVSTVVW